MLPAAAAQQRVLIGKFTPQSAFLFLVFFLSFFFFFLSFSQRPIVSGRPGTPRLGSRLSTGGAGFPLPPAARLPPLCIPNNASNTGTEAGEGGEVLNSRSAPAWSEPGAGRALRPTWAAYPHP